MHLRPRITRREWLAGTAAGSLASVWMPAGVLGAAVPSPKKVAAIITAYERGLHADVLIGKILEGWKQDGGPGPALTVASMYVEQFTDRDLARGLSHKYNVPLFDTIAGAVTVGSDRIPVDGVISIGEHGNYPWNDKEQHLYPRRRFFEEIAAAFQKCGQVVPVFNDKHLGPVWEDARWMYERARELKIPFMAGSSLPVSFRQPELTIPLGCELAAAVGVGYSGLDIYGAHTLDCYQCLVERRAGAERGVAWVQCLQGEELWRVVDNGVISKEALDAALAVVGVPLAEQGRLRASQQSALFLFQYHDGFLGTVFMFPDTVRGIAAAVKLKGEDRVRATHFEERPEPRHPHFAYLLKAIERMFHTGRPSYPVERTLLTSGILDRALTSRAQGHVRLNTPELAIAYDPIDYPHAPQPALDSDPRL